MGVIMDATMKEIGDKAREVLQKIKDESLVVAIKPLKDKLDNKDSLSDLAAYRLVEEFYFCKDIKIPDYIKRQCLSVHLMLPSWD
jgi:hypothetical protein